MFGSEQPNRKLQFSRKLQNVAAVWTKKLNRKLRLSRSLRRQFCKKLIVLLFLTFGHK
ncbi:hypothetical protein HanIR_Chr09g0426671 [Helianthus annuus]|nr:hypothetical protein HanIR_Chr09g0426671 [Helianthus annuus]